MPRRVSRRVHHPKPVGDGQRLPVDELPIDAHRVYLQLPNEQPGKDPRARGRGLTPRKRPAAAHGAGVEGMRVDGGLARLVQRGQAADVVRMVMGDQDVADVSERPLGPTQGGRDPIGPPGGNAGVYEGDSIVGDDGVGVHPRAGDLEKVGHDLLDGHRGLGSGRRESRGLAGTAPARTG